MSAQTDRLRKKLESLPKAAKTAVQAALIKEGDMLVHAMQALVPVDTGRLRASITATPPGQQTPAFSQPGGSTKAAANEVIVTAGNQHVRYAHLVEYGTSHSAAEPFFWPAYRMLKGTITKDIKKAVTEAVKEKFNDEPSLSLQAAVRDRLTASAGVTALVPADNILDKNSLPQVFPCVVIGEGQVIPDEGIARNRHQVFLDLHIWQKELGLAQAKAIAGAARAALKDRPWTASGLNVADLHFPMVRFMRDNSGLYSHGVITLKALVEEV